MEDWSVEEWLKKAGMGRYAQAFQDNGYETPELCANLKDEDLDAVGIVSKQHRSKIFALAKTLLELEAATSSQANDSYNNNNTSFLGSSPPSMYSEPWTGGSKQNGVAMHATEATDSHFAVNRKTSGEKKKGAMPPVKTKRQAKPKRTPTSPSLPPAPYQREEGAPVLTSLQLKLKIREELQKDGILLSEPPYCKDGDQLDEGQLVELAERYSQRFLVDSLGVYDALVNVWQHSMNKSGYVLPAPRELEKKPSEGSSSTLDSTSNYDEPFDAQSGASPRPLARVASHEVPMVGKPKLSPKSQTLPPNGFQTQNYDEPFDTVSTPTGSSPKQLKAKQPTKQEVQTSSALLHNPPMKRSASSGSSPEEKRKLSADNGGQRSPRTSPRTSPRASPKHSPITTKPSMFRRFWKKQRSNSVREFDVPEETKSSRKQRTSKDEHKHKHKHGSAENLAKQGVPSPSKPHRTSVPIITFQEGKPGSPPPPVPPNRLLSSYESTTSESDDSPHPPKKHQFGTKFRKKSQSPPTRHRKPTEEEFSSGESYSEQDRGMMPLPRMRKMITTSDFELHKISEDSDSRQQSLRLSQSHEELRNTGVTFANAHDKEKKQEKQAKKPGFISRIFKRKTATATPTLGKRSKWGRNRDSTVSESAVMTSSKSMPEIALAAVLRRSVDGTGSGEVFDPVQPSRKDTPPPKPLRQRTLRRSPIASPDESPPMQHKMVISSAASTSPSDRLIPIHGGSAPGVPSYLENRSPARMTPGTHSPEHDEITFSDSEDQKGDKTVGIKKPSHSAWSPRSKSPQESRDDSESPVPRTDSHSRSPTHLRRDNEQGPPPPTSEANLTRSSSGSSTSSTSARKPPPPPKPKQLTLKRPTPPPTVAKKPLEPQPQEKETDAPTVVPPVKPPPKPTRSKYRTLRIEGGKKTQEAVETKSKTLGCRTQSGRGLDENDPAVPPGKLPHLYMLDRCGSDGSIPTTERTSERMDGTGSLPGTPEGLRKPKPLPKPKLLMKVSPVRTEEPAVPLALETLLRDKLSEEGIDLTQMPYSSVWGESAIPSLLISRYASELSQSEEVIAPMLDEIRGKKLGEQSRDYVAAEQSSWWNHTQINTDDVDGFLTSVGLPMYSQVFRQKGYVAVQQVSELGGAGLDTFGLKPSHSEIIMRHLPAL